MQKTLEQTSEQLTDQGLASRWYVIPDYEGYASITDGKCDVYCLEAHIGESPMSGYESYAVAQLFSTKYPSLGVLFLIDRHKETGIIGEHQPIFSVENDTNFSRIFLPLMFSAFNQLCPTPTKRGVLVQIYQTKMSFWDFVHSSVYTFQLMMIFKREGQLAIIAVDFDDPLIKWVARLIGPLAGIFMGNIHQIPATKTPSNIKIAVEDGKGLYYELNKFSTAINEGFELATTYLDKHYQTET